MDEIIALSAGGVLKLYDDIYDNSVTISNFQMESLKVILVTLLTILLLKNQTISVFFIITITICMYQDAIDSDFWRACIPIPFITTLVNFSITNISAIDIFQKAIAFLVFSGVFIGEHEIFREETSIRKTIFRSSLIVVIFVLIYLTKDLSSYPFIKLFGLFGIGYILSNLLFHALVTKNKASDKEKLIPDSQSHTES